MKKMKKSALAAAVLLSLSMMGNVYAEEKLWTEPIVLTGTNQNFDLGTAEGGPYTGVYIDTEGNAIGVDVTIDGNPTLRMVTEGDIVLKGTGDAGRGISRTDDNPFGKTAHPSMVFQGRNIEIDGGFAGVYVGFENGTYTFDADNVVIKGGTRFAVQTQYGTIVKINENSMSGTVKFSSDSTVAGSGAIAAASGSKEIDIYGDYVEIVSNGNMGIYGYNGDVNIVQTGAGEKNKVYVKA